MVTTSQYASKADRLWGLYSPALRTKAHACGPELKDVTVVAVSHSAGFLDRVCTNIIHFNGLKLKKYRGNLSAFIKIHPEAKAYYELKAVGSLKFRFPDPGYLEGVKSKNKALLKMRNVGFTYPGTTRKILTGVSIFVSLVSRVAVVGPKEGLPFVANNGEL